MSAQVVETESRYHCSEIEFHENLLSGIQLSTEAYLSLLKYIKAEENTTSNDVKTYTEKHQKELLYNKISIYIWEYKMKIHKYEITKDDKTYILLEKYQKNDRERKSNIMVLKKLRKVFDDL
jgi:hypothetical protein